MASANTPVQNSLARAQSLIDNATAPLQRSDLLDAAEYFSNEVLHKQWLDFNPNAKKNTLIKAIANAAVSRAKAEGVPTDEWRHDYDVRRRSNGAAKEQFMYRRNTDRTSQLPPDPTFKQLADSVRKGLPHSFEFHIKLYRAYLRHSSGQGALEAIHNAFGHTNFESTKQLYYEARKIAVKSDGTLHEYTQTPPPSSPAPEQPTPQTHQQSAGAGTSAVGDGSLTIAAANDPVRTKDQEPVVQPPSAAQPSPILTSTPAAVIPPETPSTKPAAGPIASSTFKRPRRSSFSEAPASRKKRSRDPPLRAPAQVTLLLQKLREQPENFTFFDIYTSQLPPEHYGEGEEDAASVLRLCEETGLEEALIAAHGGQGVSLYFTRCVEKWVDMGAEKGTWYSFMYECSMNAEGEMKRMLSAQG
ncbi:hypothetical protein PRZ48_011303 [Zasmidium cellare]|uniref:Uncharacterized protein n=1 Tax=Zasmidium cellare TaxID=395010 RepID=A0ABR0E617_ZASCE|nr:hypothetical protein PRZ48_011303 [Zasmidium cellare]